MAQKKNTVLLRIMIVVIALFLGVSLNMLQFRNPFRNMESALTTAKKVSVKTGEGETKPGNAPSGASPAKEDPSSPSPPVPVAVAPDQAGPAGVEPAPTVDSGESAPPVSGDKEGVLPTSQETTKVEPSAAEGEQGKAKQELAENSVGKRPEVAVETEAGSSLPNVPKVTSGPEMVRAAKIGRQVPAEQRGPAGAENALPEAGQRPKQEQMPERAESPPEQEAERVVPQAPEQPPVETSQGKTQVSGKVVREDQKSVGLKGGRVLEVKAEEKPGEFVLTMVTDGPVERVATFHVKDPTRLGVDISGGWQYGGPLVISVGGSVVERVRLGVHPEKLRLVIDYRDKAATGLTEPVIEKQLKGVVIRVPQPLAKQ